MRAQDFVGRTETWTRNGCVIGLQTGARATEQCPALAIKPLSDVAAHRRRGCGSTFGPAWVRRWLSPTRVPAGVTYASGSCIAWRGSLGSIGTLATQRFSRVGWRWSTRRWPAAWPPRERGNSSMSTSGKDESVFPFGRHLGQEPYVRGPWLGLGVIHGSPG